jgi:hypothetical protein
MMAFSLSRKAFSCPERACDIQKLRISQFLRILSVILLSLYESDFHAVDPELAEQHRLTNSLFQQHCTVCVWGGGGWQGTTGGTL